MSELWSTSDVSRFLGCCERQVYILRDQGMPTIRVGKKVRFDPDQIKAWLLGRAENRPQAPAASPQPACSSPEPQDKPITLPGQIWLVDYECRTTAIVIAPNNNGFFAFGQDALWGFSNVTAWHRCVYCHWWARHGEQL